MKKAILVVSFGTSYKENLERTIGGIENYLRGKFKNYRLYRAFTSQRIIRKLWEENKIAIPTLEEAITQMREDGMEHIVVQPTYVVHGLEYERLKSALEGYRDFFQTLKLGEPLLNQVEDYKACVHSVIEDWQMNKEEVIVLAGHGTQGHAQAAYTMLEYAFHSMGYSNVLVGTVEGYPSVSDVMQKLGMLEPRPLRIIPFMIVSGEHVHHDLSGDERSWMARFQSMGFPSRVVERGLGEMKGIQRIFAEHVREAMES